MTRRRVNAHRMMVTHQLHGLASTQNIRNVICGVRVDKPAWLESIDAHNRLLVLNYVTNHSAHDIARHYQQRIGYVPGEQ
jgi:hypothetical protein